VTSEGFFAIMASSTWAGPVGRRPSSQLSRVPLATPTLRAKALCDRPVLARIAATSTLGTSSYGESELNWVVTPPALVHSLDRLRTANDVTQDVGYDPAGQSLGAALYQDGDMEGTRTAFQAALVQVPANGWALLWPGDDRGRACLMSGVPRWWV
jgi:hypothetical protein